MLKLCKLAGMFFIFLFFCLFRPEASGAPRKKLTLENIRASFYAGVTDESRAEELYALLAAEVEQPGSQVPPVMLAYYGGAETLLAKHAFNPFTKLSRLKKGLRSIARAIVREPNNLEIRFMRFSILHHIPGILGYGAERDADRDAVCTLLISGQTGDLPETIQTGIITFMLESGRLSAAQASGLQKLLQVADSR